MDGSLRSEKVVKSPLSDFLSTSTPTTEHAPAFLCKEVLIVNFHHAASQGDRKSVKKSIKKGVPIDVVNASGQTALYLACHNGHLHVVELLLLHGANPNERCCDEATPMHAASYSANINLLLMLIEAGGDLRLHDKHNRSVADWAAFNRDEKKQKKMVQFLKKAQTLAVSTTNKGSFSGEKSFTASLRPENSRGSLFRKKAEAPRQVNANILQTGFGKMCGDGPHVGMLGLIPLVSENHLRHDDYGVTYNNGPFMVMESMQWNHTAVTVKRLHKNPPAGGKVDLLINECENIGRLRHPHLLLLMGVCQTNYMESLVLLYERVGCGSLFTYIYQKNEHLDSISQCDIVRQLCEAVIFLHHQRLLHTAISSHAVQLITPNHAKLSNLEYMVPISSDGNNLQTGAVNNYYPNAVYNWMAPEVMAGDSPQCKSDLYSVCCVLWELSESMPPMSGMQAADIRERLVGKQSRVFVRERVVEPYRTMLHYGLAVHARDRLVTLEWMRDALTQVIMETESSLILKGEMHRRQCRYIPRYQHHPELATTTDEESDETVIENSIITGSTQRSQQNSQAALPILNSTAASSTLVDISEQYSINDIDGVMLSPEPPSRAAPKPSKSRESNISEPNFDIINRQSSMGYSQTPLIRNQPAATGIRHSSMGYRTTSQIKKQPADVEDKTSQASEESSHTVLEAPIDPKKAPPRNESLNIPSSMTTPRDTPTDASFVLMSSSSTSQDHSKPASNSSSGSRKKFFRSMRHRSSVSSNSSTDDTCTSSKSSKTKGGSSSKSSKLSLLRSVMGGGGGKRRSSQQCDVTVDISGIGKLDSDTAASSAADTVSSPPPPPVIPTIIITEQTPTPTEKGESSEQSSSPTNPFKKYSQQELTCDDIISEEVKAILARPRKILKLPSFYEKRPMPRSVTGTLLRQFSAGVSFPHPPPSLSSTELQASDKAAAGAVTLQRRSTIGATSQSSWPETTLTANLSLPIAASMAAAAASNSSALSLTESCPKLNTSVPEESLHDRYHYTEHVPVTPDKYPHYNVSSRSGENTGYKPASHIVPSPSVIPHRTYEAVSYHVPSPSPSPRPEQVADSTSPSPIAPVRKGVGLQRSSTTLPARMSTSSSIREEWLQAYAGATVPPGMTKDPFLKYRAAQRVTTRYRSMLHEAASEQNTSPTHSTTTYRDSRGRSSSYHCSPTAPPQRTGAQGTVDCSSKGPIKDIIASFQGKLEEKQAILHLKKRPATSNKDTFTSETFHTPKGKNLQIPQCSDEQLQLSLEGGPSCLLAPGVTVSTANIVLQKTVPLRKSMPLAVASPRTSHKLAFADSLQQIEHSSRDKEYQSSVSVTPRSTDSVTELDSDEHSTGSDLSDYIEHVLSSCQKSIMEQYKHPSCQHDTRYRHVSNDARVLHRSPAHTTRAGLLHTAPHNDNCNNSTSSSSTRCVSDTGLSASEKRSESDMSAHSEGSRRCSGRSIEEFYMDDDELDPHAKSCYLNLQHSVPQTSSAEFEVDSFLHGDGYDFGRTSSRSTMSMEDYDGTPYKTMDVSDYHKFKQERKMTRVTEDESGNSEDLIVVL